MNNEITTESTDVEVRDPELFIDLYTSETDEEVLIKVSHISSAFKPAYFPYNYRADVWDMSHRSWEIANDLIAEFLETVNPALYENTKIIMAFYIELMTGHYRDRSFDPTENDFQKFFGDRDFTFMEVSFTKEFLDKISQAFNEKELKTVGDLIEYLEDNFGGRNDLKHVQISKLFLEEGTGDPIMLILSTDKENIFITHGVGEK
jgi:hypothetical protein